jgi:von Willebrand factor type A domain
MWKMPEPLMLHANGLAFLSLLLSGSLMIPLLGGTADAARQTKAPVAPASHTPVKPPTYVKGPGVGPPNRPMADPRNPFGRPQSAGYPGQAATINSPQQPAYDPAARVPASVYVPPVPQDADTILLILDASYSMTEKLDEGESKMAIAKRVLLDVLQAIPPNVYVGLRVYGLSSNPITACSASQLMVPFGQRNRNQLANALISVRPTGETPISYSLQQGIQKDLAMRPGKKTVVLVTDGIETCDADPCRVAVQLVRNGSNVKINTVALGLARNYDALRQLKCISAATYGRFYTANTSAELAKGLADSLQVRTNVQAHILPKFKP